MSKIVVVNPVERSWTRNRYVLWFGACGPTRLMVWANGLEDALEEAAEWLAENAPGLIMTHDSEELRSLVREACEERGISYDDMPWRGDDDAQEAWNDACDAATVDHTYTESGWIPSWEWGICLEDPTRAELLEYAADCRAEFAYPR